MFLRITLMTAIFLSGSFGQTFFFVEQYATTEKTDNRKTLPTYDMWFQKNLVGKVGMFAWGQAGPTWRQAYVGGSYQFTKWLQAGVGGGAEEAEPMARLGSFLYFAKWNESVFAIYENGGSGQWHLAVHNHRIGKSRYGVGIHHQSFVGTGPRSEINFGPVKFWAAALWEKGGRNFMYGVRYVYFKE